MHAICRYCGSPWCTCLETDEEYEMPGPVSDSYDPEFSTGENAAAVEAAVKAMHRRVGEIIGGPPLYIVDVVIGEPRNRQITATLTEYEWRVLRFACERAGESL